MTRALIVYETRYGATMSTSEDIADIPCKEEFEVRAVNVKKESEGHRRIRTSHRWQQYANRQMHRRSRREREK
jgi:hypothetical protein